MDVCWQNVGQGMTQHDSFSPVAEGACTSALRVFDASMWSVYC